MTCPMMGGMGSGAMWMILLIMLVGGLLFLAAVGFAIYLVARRLRQDDALMVLRRRLAEGQITEEEFQRRLEVLRR